MRMQTSTHSTRSVFFHEKRIAFHETDAMGVVHHSNYVRIFEEARVAWLRDRELTHIHTPVGPYTFAVVHVDVRYLKSARFDDLVRVYLQGRLQGVRIQYRYAIWCDRVGAWLTEGSTELVPVDANLKVARLPKEVVEVFARDGWDETWPPAH